MVVGKLGKRKKAEGSAEAARSPGLRPAKSPVLRPMSAPELKAKKRKADETDVSDAPKKRKRQDGEQDGKVEAAGTLPVTEVEEISEETREVLEARGIKSLFEIQQKAFPPCYAGKDVVGRAKTGCGKTLAFVLPTVERIKAGKLTAKNKAGRRIPVVVAVAPTRELARQIFADFESVGQACGLNARCFYGGTPFGPQCEDLRNGVDILVCTPGRLLDHIRRETVNLTSCRVAVLDEADEMLSMGFQEDVESILQALPREELQTLLFSATLPKWVNALVEKHLKDPVWIDVTNQDDKNATNTKIKHKCINCPPSMRGDCIGDLCKVHAGAFGKTLIFTSTKKECDELVSNEKLAAIGAAALHGDIGQNTRDTVMDSFRSGRVKCLIATDIAARGLDVPCVDLVIQTRPCPDLEKYVHRAGRTARGGREGTCVTFYSRSEEYIVRLLEHKKGIRMQRIGPPQPSDIVQAATSDAVTQLDHVHEDSVEAFMDRAKELIADRGAEVSLAAALAAMTGHARRLRGRSLLSSYEGFTAAQLHSDREMEAPSKAWFLLKRMLPEDIPPCLKGLVLCEDKHSAIFDVPDDMVPRMLKAELWKGLKIEIPSVLPSLQERECDLGEAKKQLNDRRTRQWQTIRDKKNQDGGSSFRGRGGGGRGGDRVRGYRGQGKARDSLLSRDFYSSLNSRPTRHTYPESWDWSHLQAIKQARDQGQCGSCWAFASEQVLRAHAEINGWPSNFSVSQIVACTPNPRQCGGTGGCQGATVELAFDYALRGGLVREDVLPYPQGGGEAQCPENMRVQPADQDGILDVDGSEVHLLASLANPPAARGRDIGMVGWTKFPENKQDQMIRALVEEGPVAVAVAAGQDWNWYVRGIMLPTGCDTKFVISHAVVLFGYGVSNRRQFWHIKNSWGYDWGEGGNLRLQRLNNEESYCGWDNEPEIGSGCKGGPPKVWACGSCGILYDTAMPHFVPFHQRQSQQALQTPSFYSIREAGAAHLSK